MKKLKGVISISRSSGNLQHTMHLEIADESSGKMIARGEMSMEEFAMALTACAMRPIALDVFPEGSEEWGKKLEVQTVEIEIPENLKAWDQSIFPAFILSQVEKLEVDGWKYSPESGDRAVLKYNQHRSVQRGGKRFYTVNLRRYV